MLSLGLHVDWHTPTLDLHFLVWTVQLGRNVWQPRGRFHYVTAGHWTGHTDNCSCPERWATPDPLDRPMNELRDGLLAAAQRQENTMNTATVPPPRSDVRSLLAIPEGSRFVIVDYRDNSDHGRAQEFYKDEQGARARATALIEDPPGGNYFHPAPADLDLRIYAVERLPVGSTEKWGGVFVPGDGGYRPGHATDCSCDACARDSQRDYPEGG